MSNPDDSPRSWRGKVIAGRYALGETIGHGGASVVYDAVDDVTGRHVAVKMIRPGVPQISERARREIAALRLLRLPGVVTLQDEGESDGAPFLVMELIEGTPFPGRATPINWTDLAAPTLSMLETLARVHAAGVVHRDLKPSNVFVADDLSVTILDFGISWGPALGEALTVAGGIVGTPEYLAPEQLTGVRGDPRSDLYTIGVLLYEALTGKLPHKATTFGALAHQKMTVTPLPIRRVAPDTPRRVAQTIERLLWRDPEDRPQSVGEVIHQLFDREIAQRLMSQLPRLGEDDSVRRVLYRLERGHSVDVHGPLGTGRTRLLIDVSEALAATGSLARWVPPGTAPYSSALALFEDLAEIDDLSRAELEQHLRDAIDAATGRGEVFLLDDPELVDPWSAAIFEDACTHGGFVRVVSERTQDCVALDRMSEVDLRPLFAGPDRIFHLREDGAAELFRRTGGLPARVAAEVGAWVRAGLAHWSKERLVVTRDALQRLAGGLPVLTSSGHDEDDHPDAPGLQELLAWITLAWPHTSETVLAQATQRPEWRLQPELEELRARHRITRLDDGRYQPVASSAALRSWPADRIRDAHRSLADTLAPGTPDRLRHLTVAGSADEVIDEALHRAGVLRNDGRHADAIVALEQGLVAARRVGDLEREESLLVDLARVSLDDGTRHALQQALYDVGRALDRSPFLTRVADLLTVARDAESGPPLALRTTLDDIGPFEAFGLELWRRSQTYRIAARQGVDEEARVLDELERWATEVGDPDAIARVAEWRALQVRHGGDPLGAAQQHEASYRGRRSRTNRLASLNNAAMAYIEAGDLDAAQRAAEQARDDAAMCRAAVMEAYAEVSLRGIAYRRGDAVMPDEELVAAVAAVGISVLEGLIAVTEAAVAWRIGQLETARRLARRSVDACLRYGVPDCEVPARVLEIVCGAPAEPGELTLLRQKAAAIPDPDAAMQALGLLALADPINATELQSLAAEQCAQLTFSDPAERRDILSVAEATGQQNLTGPDQAEGVSSR